MPAQTRHVASADNATRGPYQNFQSDSDAEQLFRLQLLRLNAFPFVAALHPGLGYAVETEVEQLSVINSDGQLFRIRRRSGGAATTGRPNWQNVGLYESVPRESVAEATQVPNFSEVVAPPRKASESTSPSRTPMRFTLSRSQTLPQFHRTLSHETLPSTRMKPSPLPIAASHPPISIALQSIRPLVVTGKNPVRS